MATKKKTDETQPFGSALNSSYKSVAKELSALRSQYGLSGDTSVAGSYETYQEMYNRNQYENLNEVNNKLTSFSDNYKKLYDDYEAAKGNAWDSNEMKSVYTERDSVNQEMTDLIKFVEKNRSYMNDQDYQDIINSFNGVGDSLNSLEANAAYNYGKETYGSVANWSKHAEERYKGLLNQDQHGIEYKDEYSEEPTKKEQLSDMYTQMIEAYESGDMETYNELNRQFTRSAATYNSDLEVDDATLNDALREYRYANAYKWQEYTEQATANPEVWQKGLSEAEAEYDAATTTDSNMESYGIYHELPYVDVWDQDTLDKYDELAKTDKKAAEEYANKIDAMAWTEDEMRTFGYLYATDVDKAHEYANEINTSIDDKKKQAEIQEITEDGIDAGEWAKAQIGNVGKLGDFAVNVAEYLKTGDVKSKGRISIAEYADAVDGKISEDLNSMGTLNLGPIGERGLGDAYQIGMSVMHSALAGLTGNIGTTAIFFGSQADSAFYEAMDRGATAGQAMLYGTVTGAFEGVFEAASLDQVKSLSKMQADSKGVMKWLRSLGISNLIEGSEEINTSLADLLADALIMQDKSESNQRIEELMLSEGMSYDDAYKQVLEENFKDVAWSGISGAISGGAHYTGMSVLGNAQYKGSNAKTILNVARHSENKELASEFANKETLTKNEAGRIMGMEGEEAYTAEVKRQRAQEAADYAATVSKQEAVESYTGKVGEAARNSGDTKANTSNVTIEYNGAKAEVTGLVGTSEGNRLQLKMEDGTTKNVKVQDVYSSLPDDYKALMDWSEPLGDAAPGAVARYDGTQTVSEYMASMDMAINLYGANGISLSKVSASSPVNALTEKQKIFAEEYGASLYNKAQQIKGRSGAGTVTFGGNNLLSGMNQTTEAEAKKVWGDDYDSNVGIAQAAAKAFGQSIVFYDSTKTDGTLGKTQGLYSQTGTIYIDIHAGQSATNVGKAVITQTLSHELTHFAENSGGEAYTKLKKFMVNHMAEWNNGKTFEDLVQSKIASSSKKLSYQGAVSEVIADGCEQMLQNSEYFRQLAAEDIDTAKGIKGWLDEALKKLQKVLKASHKEAAYFDQSEKLLQELSSLWDEAMKAAVENSKDLAKLSQETIDDLKENGFTVAGGAVVTEDNARLMEEEGFSEPVDYSDAEDVQEAVRTTPEWMKSYLANGGDPDVAKSIKEYTDQMMMNDAIMGYVPSGDYKYSRMGPLRKNVEYIWTFDMDASCPRTFQFVSYRNALQKIAGRPLTFNESVNLMYLMKKMGQNIPCTYCYVENKRILKNASYLNYFMFRDGVMSSSTKEEALTKMYSYDEKKGTVSEAAQKVLDEWWGDKEKGKAFHPSAEECWTEWNTARNSVFNFLDAKLAEGSVKVGTGRGATSKKAINTLVQSHFKVTDAYAKREIENFTQEWAYNKNAGLKHVYSITNDTTTSRVDQRYLRVNRLAMNYASSVSQARNVDNYLPYTDQLKNVSKKDKQYIIGMGGLRKHSSNDFRIDYVHDYFLLFADMAKGKWTGHTYTKNVDYCKIFGRTGDRINLSIAMTTKNGKIVMNDQEGAEWKEARQLREAYGENLGVMAMVTDNAQLSFALNTDWIDMCIPFHASGLAKEVWYNINAWFDYTNNQLESFYTSTEMKQRLKDAGVSIDGLKSEQIEALFDETFHIKSIRNKNGNKVRPHFFPNDTVVNGQTVPGHHNDAKRYKELCEQYGVHPRFYGVQVTNKAGEVIDITDHENYIKVIKETSRTETEQKPIQFNVNEYDPNLGMSPMEYAMERMEQEAKNGGYLSNSEDKYGIVDKFSRLYLGQEREIGWLPEFDEDNSDANQIDATIEQVEKTTKEMYDADIQVLDKEGYQKVLLKENKNIEAAPSHGSINKDPYTGAQTASADNLPQISPEDKKNINTPAELESATQASEREQDPEVLAFLNDQEEKGEVVHTFKSFQVIDGKLYPPMAAKTKGEDGKYRMSNAMAEGEWEKSVGNPQNIKIDPKNGKGYYVLNKGNGKSLTVAYNPYQHSSNMVLNDQFEEAYKRPNLVTYECIIPKSELTSGYQAEYAKDAVGMHEWKAGSVAGKLKDNKRMVYLSRWLKPVRQLSNAEVAEKYKELLEKEGISVPFNVVTPDLLKELEKIGVPIDYNGSPMYQAAKKRAAENADMQASERDNGTNDTFFETQGRMTGRLRADAESKILKETVKTLNSTIQKQKKEMEALAKKDGITIAALRKQLKLTSTPEVRVNDARKMANKILKEYSSKADRVEVTTAIKDLGNYIVQHTGDEIDYDELQRMAREIAEMVIDNAEAELEDGGYSDQYKEIANDIKGSKFTLAKEDKGELEGGYSAFKKKYRNRIVLGEGYGGVDTAYQELQNRYGKNIFPDVGNPGETLSIMMDVYDRSEPEIGNPYEQYYDESVETLANDIMYDSIGDALRQVQPTFADKQQAKYDALKSKLVQELQETISKANERYENLRTAKNERIAEVRKQGVDKKNEAVAAEKAEKWKKVAAVREYYKDKEKRTNEKRQENAGKSKYRKQVTEQVAKLSNLLLKNSDKEHVPEALKKPLLEFLQAIDFSSITKLNGGENTKKDDKFQARFLRLQQMLIKQQDAINGNDPNAQTFDGYLDLSQESLEYLKTISEAITIAMNDGQTYTVNSMSAEQLKSLAKFLKNLNAAISKMNVLLADARYATVREAAAQDIKHMESLGRAKSTENSMKFFKWKNAVPYFAFQRFGEGARAIFDGFTRGWERLAFNSNEIINFTRQTYTPKEVREWKKQIHTITLENGKTIQMTTAQIMELSQLLGRSQALGHIEAGGVRIGNIDLGKSVKAPFGETITDTTHYHFTENDIANILSNLSDRQLDVAKKLRVFMATRGATWGNEVSMKRFGYEFYTEGEEYYPILTDSNDRGLKDTDAKENSMFRLLNLSSSKSLTPHANNALIVNDIFDTFADHMADQAKLNAMGLPVLDAIKWFNYKEKTKNEDGTIDTTTTQAAMEQAFGSEAQKYFRTLIKDINGVKESGDRGTDFASKLMTNYKIASVGANLRVALLQPTSYVRASFVIKPKYLLAAFKEKNGYKEALKYSGTALWKSLGYYDTNISRSLRQQIENDTTLRDDIAEKAMTLAEKGDSITWGRMWVACKMQTRAENPGITGEALNQKTADLFREVIYSSQVMDSTLTRSEIMRGSTIGTKSMTAFMSEPTLSYNILLDAYSKYELATRKNGKKAAWNEHKGTIGKAFAVYAASAAFSAIVESLADAVRDSDDDYFWDKFLEALIGEEDENGKRDVFGSNLTQDLLVSGKIPILKELVSAIQGYGSSNMSTEAITAIVNALMIWNETIALDKGTKEKATSLTYYGKMTTWGKIYKTLQPLSQAVGLPVSAGLRDVFALWNTSIGSLYPELKVKTYDKNQLSASKVATYNESIKPTGVTKKTYEKILKEADESANGSITQDEMGSYLRAAVSEGMVTASQANAIWDAQGWKKTRSEWQAKNK